MANTLYNKSSRTQIYKTLPSNDVGFDGDIILSQIQGRGVYLCSKVNGRWHVSSKMEELRKIENTSTKDLTTNKLQVLDNLAIGRGTTTITKDEAKFTSSLKIKEASNAISDTVAYGQLWVKTATPNELYFTTDAGNDIQLTSGTTAAGGGASALNDLSDVTYSSGDLTITSLDKIIASTALTIQTTDSGGHASDLTFDIDGDAIFDMNSDVNNRIKFQFGQAGTDLFQIKADSSFNAIEMGAEDGNYSLIKLLAEGGTTTNDYFQIFVEAQGVTEISTVDSSGANGILSLNPDGQLRFDKPPRIKEQASADADQANFGQLWVKNDTPNNLYFTNDAGNDVQITNGASLAGGGGSSTTFRHIINGGFNYSFGGGTSVFIPLSAREQERATTQTSMNELLAFVSPYDGYLNQVVFRSEEACGSTVLGLHRSATGTEIPNQTASNTVTVDMTTDDTPYNFAFGASASFSAGEILGISMNPTNDPNDTVFTVEFIFDSSSGL